MVKLCSLVISTILLVAATAHAEIYRWVDKEGNVHFTDTPPVATPVTEVDVRVQSAASEQPAPDRRASILALSEQRASDSAAEHARLAAPNGATRRARTAETACHQARIDYYWLNHELAVYVDVDGRYRARYRGDPYQGERTWLNEAERQAALTATNKRLGEFCADPLNQEALAQAAYEVQLAEACTIARARMDAMLSEQSRTADDHIDEQAVIVGRVCSPPA